MPGRPRILSISFSHFPSDARVLRQLAILREFGDVTTVGYGDGPDGVVEHLSIPAHLPSLPQTPTGVAALALHRFRAVELAAPAVRAALELIGERRFDVIVANEARALPLAHAVRRGARIWGDMHEWAPEERTHVLSWRLLVAPYMRWVCAGYLPGTDAVTTVNRSIADLYETQFGIACEVVRNAIPRQPLQPSPPEPGRIRLVHSGGAVPGRNIEALIDATLMLDDRFTLDLYLVQAKQDGGYFDDLGRRASGADRVTIHPAVTPAELPGVLNRYDLGVYALPQATVNHRLMLPNKFFDFVQARLGLVFGPAVETDALIDRYGLGVVTAGYSAADIADALRPLDGDAVRDFKAASDRASAELSSEADESTERAILARLVASAA
ncbi:glycosyltransferase [Agromyces sp. GXS1127]|uniref:glycosyltransferase n=1 Tax=Agromyces sp. GXS1127 TaxID=3424181 RepID=UPI003D30FD75